MKLYEITMQPTRDLREMNDVWFVIAQDIPDAITKIKKVVAERGYDITRQIKHVSLIHSDVII